MLNVRLAELAEARLLTRDGEVYRLTPLGEDLVAALGPLDAWSRRWAAELDGGESRDAVE
ncbi:winged helix-turn-helix transcriptional regulator [Kitasatospora sp. NPDC001159]